MARTVRRMSARSQARGQPAIVRLLPQFVMPAATAFGPTRRAMAELVTGLDHPIKVVPVRGGEQRRPAG